MTIQRTLAMLLTLALLPISLTAGGAPPSADLSSSGLDQLKQLAGRWQGTNSKGSAVDVSYEVTAGGSVVLERLKIADHPEMLTLYYLDRGRLMLTHYCMTGNQPRMQAEAIGDAEIRFDFVDAGNLTGPDAGHMHGAVLTFTSPKQFQSAWTWRENGKDQFTEVIQVKRVD